MTGESDLSEMLKQLSPELHPGQFVFTSVDVVPESVNYMALVIESEGITLILDQAEADRFQLEYDYVAAMITLNVHSNLASVGLTATVASTLASAGISCNVVAGFHHDHLFVPADRASETMVLLHQLSA